MNIMELGAIGELIGGIAVIGSLIYVGLEVRSNTRTQKASSGTSTLHNWAEFNLRMSENPDIVALIPRIFDPNENLADFDAPTAVRAALVSRSLMQKFEAEYYQFQAGLLNAELWGQHRSWCHGYLKLPVVSAWWATELEQPLYTTAFLRDIATAPDTTPVSIASLSDQ